MSALLAITTVELNICAEYGYSSRVFNKYPYVYQTDTYTSSLFLVYRQPEYLENRIDRFRNHFALYRNDTSVCIARTETLLQHSDNDAIITYDIITPKANVDNRLRTQYKNWTVSFDRIEYSCEFPDFLSYKLIGTGEWWFFDDGICLNGLTSYDKLDTCCETLFVYYELHTQNKINKPQNNTIAKMPPCIQVNNVPVPLQPQQTTNAQPPPVSSSSSSTSESGLLNLQSLMQTPIPPQFVNSIPSELLSSINATTTCAPIQTNDATTLAQRQKNQNSHIFKSVMPSLFWFDERIKEFKAHKIDYFKPLNFKVPLPYRAPAF